MLTTLLLALQLATQTQKFWIDYAPDSIAVHGVVRFEVQIDKGDWISAGMPEGIVTDSTFTGALTYPLTIPAMTPGEHTVRVRACNETVCSAGTPFLTFKFGVMPPDGVNLRISK